MKHADIIINSFINMNLSQLCKVPIIAVYKNPSDYPEKYVARLWDIHKRPTLYVLVKDDIEDVRWNIPEIMYRLEPSPKDDPTLVETWL